MNTHQTTPRQTQRQIIPSAIEGVEPLCFAGGRVAWHGLFGKLLGHFLLKLSMRLPCVPAILLLGVFPKDLTEYMHRGRGHHLYQRQTGHDPNAVNRR